MGGYRSQRICKRESKLEDKEVRAEKDIRKALLEDKEIMFLQNMIIRIYEQRTIPFFHTNFLEYIESEVNPILNAIEHRKKVIMSSFEL